MHELLCQTRVIPLTLQLWSAICTRCPCGSNKSIRPVIYIDYNLIRPLFYRSRGRVLNFLFPPTSALLTFLYSLAIHRCGRRCERSNKTSILNEASTPLDPNRPRIEIQAQHGLVQAQSHRQRRHRHGGAPAHAEAVHGAEPARRVSLPPPHISWTNKLTSQ